ncbi:MAG TPA: UDP-glucose/GDP-mannose dehydrogenase family protein, partial [Burkholderiaceae bacterium]|nr:UDP-glucose/GDP-mannose dehydrogenase family protein [Burkholderiaceae bacterium]
MKGAGMDGAERAAAGRRLAVFGAGYVGLVTAVCLAWLGHEVLCVDRQLGRVRQLRRGSVPFHEPGLGELLQAQLQAGRLRFGTSAQEAVEHGELLFIAVGTPTAADGGADLAQVLAVADEIGARMPGPRQVVVKSTVPVGSCERVERRIREGLARRGAAWELGVASNPEFLREGSAVQDFLQPERVVAGSADPRVIEALRALHAPLTSAQRPFLAMDLRSAELCKYASNVMLAARLSLMNELALLAEGLGADIEQVREGVGRDGRIGRHYLRAGCGFGGSCLPKDLRALRRSAAGLGLASPMLDAIAASNDRMVGLLEARVCEALGPELGGRRIAVWGLAFKPGTDDVRDAPALALVRGLCARGAQVQAYDPLAGPAARQVLGELA